jgi:WD40 repeat protein
VAFSPDGSSVVSGSRDRSIRVWDLESQTCVRTMSHTSNVKAVALSPDGRWVTFGSGDRDLRIWNMD